jgi:hypothetical protein
MEQFVGYDILETLGEYAGRRRLVAAAHPHHYRPPRRDNHRMASDGKRYRYVGPAELSSMAVGGRGTPITSQADLDQWLASQDRRDLDEPFTFVVDLDGQLRLAARRTEHVACASGQEVLSAGEMQFARRDTGWVVEDVSNQSTGYCPDLDSWPAVAAALDRACLRHPEQFTRPIVFRLCPSCHERNIVRDGIFVCALCDAPLPQRWNFG